jgi:hypothetical protein
MRSMVEGAGIGLTKHAPSTADAAKPAQAAQACLRWAVPLPRNAGEDAGDYVQRFSLHRSLSQ